MPQKNNIFLTCTIEINLRNWKIIHQCHIVLNLRDADINNIDCFRWEQISINTITAIVVSIG
jgi:hypothetical protein